MVLENDSNSEKSICDAISDFEKFGSCRQLKSCASPPNSDNEHKGRSKLRRSLAGRQIQESTPGNFGISGKGCEGLLRWRRSRSRRLKRLRRRRRSRERQTKACLTITPSLSTRRRNFSRGRPQKRRRISRTRNAPLRSKKRRKRISRSRRKRTSGSVRRRRSRSARSPRRTRGRRISRRRRQRPEEIAV